MSIAEQVGNRSTCSRRQIGTVITNENREIVATGYNGNPRGMVHCETIGCIRDEMNIPSGERVEICTAVHAEQNALLQAGRASSGGTMYTIVQPCNVCAKMIVNAGIQRVVFRDSYPDQLGLVVFKHLGVATEKLLEGGGTETVEIRNDVDSKMAAAGVARLQDMIMLTPMKKREP